MKTKYILPLLLYLCVTILSGCGQPQASVTTSNTPHVMDYSWLDDYRVIAHAFGGIEEYTYTNSLEAFEANYDAGHRLFEVDFMLTSDNIAVAGHDWKHFYSITGRETGENTEAAPLSLAEFKESVIFDKFTPLTWVDIVQLMIEYPDIYIVTDTKDTVDPMITTTFTQMVKEAKNTDPTILDRIIPQIYNNEMYDIIYQIHPWKSVIYTLYNQADEFSYDDVYDFASSHGIKVIATFPARSDLEFTQKIHDMGGYLFMYTFNDMEQVETHLISHGIHGVYTDFLAPDDLEPMFH